MTSGAMMAACVASRLGRRPKRLKEMQLAAAAAAAAGCVSMSASNCASSTDQHLDTSSSSAAAAAMQRHLCLPSSVTSSIDVSDVHAELQVLPFQCCICIADNVLLHLLLMPVFFTVDCRHPDCWFSVQ